MAADLSSDHDDSDLVIVDSVLFISGGKRSSLALGRLGDGFSAIRDRSLRWEDWKVSKHWTRQVGLLHGSPPGLRVSLFDHHRLLIYPA